MLYRIPWDLNNTFGDIWKNDAEDTNHTLFAVGDLVMDNVFEVLIGMNDRAINRVIQQRWAQLRTGSITEETLIALARSLHGPLFDAIERDSIRWPRGGMGEGNALNIRDVEAYIRQILPRIDEYVAGLDG